MKLLSVQVGQSRPVESNGRVQRTAIDKRPVDGPVAIGPNGVEGDVQANQEHHGGPDQAVYVYSAVDYAWWSNELSRPLSPGQFGENLTVSGLGDPPLYIGDRFAIGEVILEVTSPRIPCNTLATRMGDSEFVRKFRKAARPGVYCRVIQPGTVSAGDRLDRIAGDRLVTAIAIFRLYFDKAADESRLRHALRAPLARRTREIFENRLDRA